MLDFARDIIAAQPILALFLAIGVGLLRGADQHRPFLARRRGGVICWPRYWRLCPEVSDYGTHWAYRPDYLSLLHLGSSIDANSSKGWLGRQGANIIF
jgi:hypothetical protein